MTSGHTHAITWAHLQWVWQCVSQLLDVGVELRAQVAAVGVHTEHLRRHSSSNLHGSSSSTMDSHMRSWVLPAVARWQVAIQCMRLRASLVLCNHPHTLSLHG
jgi:hypothetical protein